MNGRFCRSGDTLALFKQGNTSLNKRASLGLRVITTIASASSHRTVTAETLATVTEVSRSYIEAILKDAREFGLIQAIRGPGGVISR